MNHGMTVVCLAIQCVLQLQGCSTPLQLQRHLQWPFLKMGLERLYWCKSGGIGIVLVYYTYI